MNYYATIGPSCAEEQTLLAMKKAGMTGIRMNVSHTSLSERKNWVELIKKTGITDFLIDLNGPELRCQNTEELLLQEGETILLGSGLPLPKCLLSALVPGTELVLDDGKFLLCVETENFARVIRGGLLLPKKTVLAKNLRLSLPSVTEADIKNLLIAEECGVTAVMFPFVRGKQDLLNLKEALAACGVPSLKIFAKIETLEGVDALPEISEEADVIVIARGDLGTAMPLWELPRVQKQIAACCRKQNVPFIIATHLLESMRKEPQPTRAEVCDIYQAVLDGASGLMLTGETAAGDYPALAVQYLSNTAETALKDRV